MGFMATAEKILGFKKTMQDPTQPQGQPIMVTEEVPEGAQPPIASAPDPVQPQSPVAPVPPVPDAPETPAAQQAASPKPSKAKPGFTVPKEDDRSAYNCPDCGGEGLKDGNNPYEICPRCKGTGKI